MDTEHIHLYIVTWMLFYPYIEILISELTYFQSKLWLFSFWYPCTICYNQVLLYITEMPRRWKLVY